MEMNIFNVYFRIGTSKRSGLISENIVGPSPGDHHSDLKPVAIGAKYFIIWDIELYIIELVLAQDPASSSIKLQDQELMMLKAMALGLK